MPKWVSRPSHQAHRSGAKQNEQASVVNSETSMRTGIVLGTGALAGALGLGTLTGALGLGALTGAHWCACVSRVAEPPQQHTRLQRLIPGALVL